MRGGGTAGVEGGAEGGLAFHETAGGFGWGFREAGGGGWFWGRDVAGAEGEEIAQEAVVGVGVGGVQGG